MDPRFKLYARRSKESLHLALVGDFNERSAWELLKFLEENHGSAKRAVVHTGGLHRVHGSGRETFRRHVRALKRSGLGVSFCGKRAEEIVPARHISLDLPEEGL